MKKVRISALPKMTDGGLSPEQRAAWNNMQSAAYQQGFLGDDHNRQPGVDFMRTHGVDPSMLSAYQQDLGNQGNVNPWGQGNAASASRGWSPVDNFYGDKTSRERYVNYSIQNPGQPAKNFGTDWKAATDFNNNYLQQRANPAPAPWTSNDQGVSMPTASNTTPAPIYGKREQKSNWHTGENADYSIDAVRTAKFGGVMKKKVRITGVPAMANGGNYIPEGENKYASQQSGRGYALDRFWSSPAGYQGTSSQVNPFDRVGNTLPEAQDGGDINAEKQERILGDFDQDGQQELMNVNGPSHAEGGKDVNVPSHSFVFSDTKDLKIKNPSILAMFGLSPKRGGYTPAEVSKKYDLNKYKTITSDPNADDYASKTAQLMSDNYLAKLNKLAQIQEEMKHHMGLQNSAQITRMGGPVKRYADGGSHQRPNSPEEWDAFRRNQIANPVMDPMYPPLVPPPHGSDWMPFDPEVADAQGYTGNPNTADYQTWANLRGAGLTVDDKMGRRTTGWQNPDAGIQPLGIDYKPFEAKPAEVIQQQIADKMVPAPIADGVKQKSPDNVVTKVKTDPIPGFRMNPNFYGNLLNTLQMAQLRKFRPYEPVPQAVIADSVFMDPTRAIAAQQEHARLNEEADNGTTAGRAQALGRQGVAGAQAADIIGQTHNQNIGIANTANQQAAQVTNNLMQQQASRLAELNKANFLSDRDYQREMGKLQSEWVDRMQKQHDTAVKTTWLNKVSPFFNIDPIDQMPDFKSSNAKAEFQKMYGPNAGQSTPDMYKRAQGIYDQLLMNPMYQSEEGRKQALMIAGREAGLRSSESEIYKPGATMPTMRYTGLPMGAGMPNTYGMGYGFQKNGGPLLKMGGKVDLYNNDKLKKFMK